MISEDQLQAYYAGISQAGNRALDDIEWYFKQLIEKTEQEIDQNYEHKSVYRILNLLKISKRVKTYDSILRKSVRDRDKIKTIDDIPKLIEDLLGFRITTPNKEQARILYRWFND